MIRRLLAFEALAFILAALVHFGVILPGFEHGQAAIAESVIAAALLIGLAVTYARPGWWRPAAIGAQAFALLGTLVGVFTILLGVGPRTVPDVAYHLGILVVLAWGLALTVRTDADASILIR